MIDHSQGIFYNEYNPKGKMPVLLLHGMGVTGDSWQLQVPVLVKAGFRIFCPDLPGFGQSKPIPGGWKLSLAVNRLVDWVKILPAPLEVVGISLGGVFAMHLALEVPQNISRLVLVNAFDRLRPPHPSQWIYYLRRFGTILFYGLDRQAELVAQHLFPEAEQAYFRQVVVEQIRKSDPAAYRAVMRDLALFNLRPHLRKINCPVLVVSGEEDRTIPLKLQKDLTTRIPGARQKIIADAGHAVIADHSDEFNQILLDYLAETAARPGQSQAGGR